jgi:hypothetical protein
VRTAHVRARRPADVAREVELDLQAGFQAFELERIAGGDMLDRERLGAARYAAGLQAEVELVDVELVDVELVEVELVEVASVGVAQSSPDASDAAPVAVTSSAAPVR